MKIEDKKRIVEETFLGAAVGDALGVPYEFLSRAEVRRVFIPEMVGSDTGLTFESRWGKLIPAGAFSDDTSMLIAAASAFVDAGGDTDYRIIMQNFNDWWTKGRFCSLDQPFGLGKVVSAALQGFSLGWDPLQCGGTLLRDNGNGSLMRILPFSLYAIFRDLTWGGDGGFCRQRVRADPQSRNQPYGLLHVYTLSSGMSEEP